MRRVRRVFTVTAEDRFLVPLLHDRLMLQSCESTPRVLAINPQLLRVRCSDHASRVASVNLNAENDIP